MSSKLILIGGGGHCQSCIDVIEQENKYEITGILDQPSKVGTSVLDYSIIGSDEQMEKFIEQGFRFLITVGQVKSPAVRIKIFDQLNQAGGMLSTIKSPLAYVSKHASIGEGTIIMHGAIVNAGAVIGANCIINSGALIEHGASIGDHCHISTHSVINGDVKIENEVFVGSGAVLREGLHVQKGTFVKAHSLVK